MSTGVKLILYAALIVLACVSGSYALAQWRSIMDRPRPEVTDLEKIEPDRPEIAPETNAELAVATNTNRLTGRTNTAGTNVAIVSNALSLLTNGIGARTNGTDTNALLAAASTNGPALDTNASSFVRQKREATALGSRGPSGDTGQSRIGLWSGVFILSLIGLGFLIAMDVAHYFGNRTLDVLYNDEGKGVGNPEYEAAEQVWASGNHLEAIRMMRDYLNKNPREQYVALRIAEIYEKDLGNYLAAALEYEEVLKYKLPAERWGWAAIHLCNLYFKLDKEQNAYELLRRLVKEHPQTAAAEKARKRLEQVDGSEAAEEPSAEGQISAAPKRAESQAEQQPTSNLPPGFKPKK